MIYFLQSDCKGTKLLTFGIEKFGTKKDKVRICISMIPGCSLVLDTYSKSL